MKKIRNYAQVLFFQEIPNIGPAMAKDFKLLGLRIPADLKKQDPYKMYFKLCQVTKQKHDPCVLDVFISAVRFMQGYAVKPWWFYTKERKKTLKKVAPHQG